MVIPNLEQLRDTSVMKCRAGFFMGNSLFDPKDPLIPFSVTSFFISRQDLLSPTIESGFWKFPL
jgi:hypothetical protein